MKRPYKRKAAAPAPDSLVPSEHDTQAAILAYLATIPHVKAWRNNTGAVKFGEGEAKKRFVRFSPVGSSDVFAIFPPRGRFVSIEVKAPGKVPSDAQRQWLQECADAGAVALYCDNLDDLIRELRDAGLIR